MKESHQQNVKINRVSPSCTALEHPLGDGDINAVVIEINGRYPNSGRTVNEVCKELAYVISGGGKVVVEDKEVMLSEGSVVLIEPGEKFYWEGKGLRMFMPCTPAWYPEQHKEVK